MFWKCVIIFSFGLNLYAKPWLVGIRGNEQATEIFASQNKLKVAVDSSEEFSNGNTFVRFKSTIKNSDAIILLPDSLDSNTLMEVLLKIHTLKTNGAHNIVVASNLGISQTHLTGFPELKLENLLATAGANEILEPNFKNGRKLKPKKNVKTTLGAKAQALITGDSHPELAKELSQITQIELVKGDATQLADGGKSVYLLGGLKNSPTEFNASFFKLLSEISALTRQGNEVNAITPYQPLARSDKIDQEGISVGGRLAANLIVDSGAKAVTFIRPHAPQSVGFYSGGTFVLNNHSTLLPYLKEVLKIDRVIGPDEGSQKSVTEIAEKLGVPVGIINQRRDPKTRVKKLFGFSGKSVKGQRVVIIDDETETGGTLASAAELMKKRGAKEVYVLISHITGNARKALDCPHIDGVITTNTMPTLPSSPKLTVLSVAPEIADLVRELELGRSQRSKSICRGLRLVGS